MVSFLSGPSVFFSTFNNISLDSFLMPLIDALAVHRFRVMKRTVGHNMAEQLESRKHWRSAKFQLTQLFSNRTKTLCKVSRCLRRLNNVTNWHYASEDRPRPRFPCPLNEKVCRCSTEAFNVYLVLCLFCLAAVT